jgi:isopentenyldiphosphate isomerase
MDEIVDVVDEDDNVIGQELKSICHANKILHRGSSILIFKDSSFKEIALQKRSMKKTSNPGKLCITGGHLKTGDDYLAAAKRELQEEMFHDQELPEEIELEELFKIKKFTDNDYEYQIIYRVVWPGPFSHDPDEVESSKFVGLDRLIEDTQKHPQKYTGTTRLLADEYKKRFLS